MSLFGKQTYVKTLSKTYSIHEIYAHFLELEAKPLMKKGIYRFTLEPGNTIWVHNKLARYFLVSIDGNKLIFKYKLTLNALWIFIGIFSTIAWFPICAFFIYETCMAALVNDINEVMYGLRFVLITLTITLAGFFAVRWQIRKSKNYGKEVAKIIASHIK